MVELKAWLKDKGMTQREFAERMGFHEVYVSRVIIGATPMTDGFRGKFARVFGAEEYGRVFGGNGCAEPEAIG